MADLTDKFHPSFVLQKEWLSQHQFLMHLQKSLVLYLLLPEGFNVLYLGFQIELVLL